MNTANGPATVAKCVAVALCVTAAFALESQSLGQSGPPFDPVDPSPLAQSIQPEASQALKGALQAARDKDLTAVDRLCKAAIDADPNDANVHVRVDNILRSLNLIERAIQAYQKALSLNDIKHILPR